MAYNEEKASEETQNAPLVGQGGGPGLQKRDEALVPPVGWWAAKRGCMPPRVGGLRV